MATPKKYHAKQLKFVQDNLLKIGFEGCAEKLGVRPAALLKQLSTWRANGETIPYLRKLTIGITRKRTSNGIEYLYEKTPDGWRRVKRLSPADQKPINARQTAKAMILKEIPKPNTMLAGKNLINQHKVIRTPEPFNPSKHKLIPHPMSGIDPRFRTAKIQVAI